MRIIAGKYKRTPLLSLEGDATRPTKDMVKEALFDSLQIVENDSMLDLFSGTGSIGIEAISRGAYNVVFNDSNKNAVKVIEANLKHIKENKRVLNLDYKECLRILKDERFKYIFMDPPYAFEEYEEAFKLIDELNVLNDLGIIIVEVKKTTDLKEEYLNFIKYKEKKYGISKLVYYRKKA